MDFEDFDDFDTDLFDDKEDESNKELNDDEVLNKVIEKTEQKDGKKKRTISMKPRPKLTDHILTGPKGLCALRKLFEKWQPNEKKSPYDNLDEMMEKVEYWGHLLYPKSNFDDLLSKVEQLGKKRPVKVYMTKLRLGMPLFEDGNEKENQESKERRSESPFDKPLSPLPDDDFDFFNDENQQSNVRQSESRVEKPMSPLSDDDYYFDDENHQESKKRRTESPVEKPLSPLSDDDFNDDENQESKERRSESPIDKPMSDDEDAFNVEAPPAPKRRRIVYSDDEEEEM